MGPENLRVGVFGLGYVGLPLALSFALRGCRVVGVDTNVELVAELNAGITYHREQYQGEGIQSILRRQLAAGRFTATTSAAQAMESCDNIIVTVGLPVHDGEPFAGYLEECCRDIARGLKKGDLVVVRGTLVPGMTRRLVLPLLEQSGLKAGRDFALAYSSERIAEGRAFEEFVTMPGLVSGLTENCRERARRLLAVVTEAPLHPASSFEVVETAKVVENISRDVNIALVNELARFTKELGVDVFEVIALANTHRRVSLLQPGPGVGGYCLPNALYYLDAAARRLGVPLELMHTARRVNEEMPRHVVNLVLRRLPVPPARAKIAVLGLAMKDYSGDDRLSPALTICQLLLDAGVQVAAFDPAVQLRYNFQVDSMRAALSGAHGAVALARQHGIDFTDWDLFLSCLDRTGVPFIIDTRQIYRGVNVPSGILVESI
ncbi:MAG: nucleotide sugar dehydrogenase [Desulfurispora sp.]|uniref:nucleotide sugar dehydrogenase n=1 Tax=Desulfurispora sp. TaxID=3014275 RepID=UPI00404AA073